MQYIFLCVINGVLTFQAHWNFILIRIGVSESIIDTYTKSRGMLRAL